MTFNIMTIALPKIIDERIGASVPLVAIGSIATGVFIFGALTQLLMGRLIDRFSLTTLFVLLTPLQPIGLRACRSDHGLADACRIGDRARRQLRPGRAQ